MIVMPLLSFLYLGIFLKVYILPAKVSWVKTSPVSLLPFFLIYIYELIVELVKGNRNWRKKRAHLGEVLA